MARPTVELVPDRVPKPAAWRLAGDQVARAVVARMYRGGATAHPTVELAEPPFSAGIETRAADADARDAEPPRERLSRMERLAGGPDLFLAIACDRHAAGSWDRLASTYVPRLARGLTAQGVPAAEADAIAADVPGDLLQPPRDGAVATRIGLYRGLSSLFSFLLVSALRRWTNAARSRRVHPIESLDGAAPPPEPARHDASPLDRLVGEEATARIDAALSTAWREFTPREALALLYKHRDGLPQKTVAALLEVGEPRVSRLLARGIERLTDAVTGAFGTGRDRLTPPERSAVTAALERRLATFAIPPPPPSAAMLKLPRTPHAS